MVKKRGNKAKEEVIPDPAPKIEHLKKLLEKAEEKQEFKHAEVLFLSKYFSNSFL